jgi:outer membrane protein OmpA-like peptidoglycan-associated protein
MNENFGSRMRQWLGAGAHLACLAALAVAAAGVAPEARAQSESVQDMIQQLQGGKQRTRGMRNLNVESTAPGAANGAPANGTMSSFAPPADARPSISLQIQFDFDSANVRPESMASIERLSRAIGSPELAAYRFAIEGHTDAQGRADYNRRLSDLRAQRVKAILVQSGVDPNRLYAVGKGSSEPANPHDPRAAENRRVRIVNLD